MKPFEFVEGPLGLALSGLEIQNLQGSLVTTLEASHWHLQGTSCHDFLLKIWVIKDGVSSLILP